MNFLLAILIMYTALYLVITIAFSVIDAIVAHDTKKNWLEAFVKTFRRFVLRFPVWPFVGLGFVLLVLTGIIFGSSKATAAKKFFRPKPKPIEPEVTTSSVKPTSVDMSDVVYQNIDGSRNENS